MEFVWTMYGLCMEYEWDMNNILKGVRGIHYRNIMDISNQHCNFGYTDIYIYNISLAK